MCTVSDVLVFLSSIHLTIHGFRFIFIKLIYNRLIFIKLIIIILQFSIIQYMQLFCSHNDFNLNQFLSHCRHPLQVERSDIYMHVHTCIHTYIRGGSRINCSGGLGIPCEILCATPTLDVISAQDMLYEEKVYKYNRGYNNM